jgi:ABC-type nitrate/sulfonate/bicarbonate transport system substrate-binding protein
MNNKSMLIGFFGVLLALVTPHSAPAQSSRLPQLKLAVSTATPHNTPLWVAKDKKIFDKFGIDVQMIFVMGGALVSQMLAAGESMSRETRPPPW